MDYEEAMDGHPVSDTEMVREMRRHSMTDADIEQFREEHPNQTTYRSDQILIWLGY